MKKIEISHLLTLLKCLRCQSGKFRFVSFAKAPSLVNGVFRCEGCGHYYPLEDGILDGRPDDLIPREQRKSFEERFSQDMKASGCLSYQPQEMGRAKEEQFVFEESNAGLYEEKVVQTPFWTRILHHAMQKWSKVFPPRDQRGLFLDIGCGTGRLSFELAKQGFCVLGADVTYSLLRLAVQKARAEGVQDQVLFLAADIWHLPFQPKSFDGLGFFGFFHHLQSPYAALEKLTDFVKESALMVGVDNNQSMFRRAFDFLMKSIPLWHEDEDLSHGQLDLKKMGSILSRKGFSPRLSSLCFIPPHCYSFLPAKISDMLYFGYHFIFSHLPFLSRQGGLLCLSATRQKHMPSEKEVQNG